jgi:hypothetical protein
VHSSQVLIVILKLLEPICLCLLVMLETGELLLKGPFGLSLNSFYKAGPCLANHFLDLLRMQAKCPQVGDQVSYILGAGNTCHIMT